MTQHDYTYDIYGNRITHNQNVATNTLTYGYGYDELSRLVSVTGGVLGAESYTYDPLNNLKSRLASGVTTTYNHDNANQLTEVLQGGTRVKGMVYDAAGNLTQKCEGANVNVTNIPFTACNGTTNSTYTYDDQGRRLSKTAGATTTKYLYNGQDILAEYQGTWGAALAHLTHGPGTDEPLQLVQGAAAVAFMQDGLGSVAAAVPHSDVNNGANAAFQMFDAWGNRTQGSGTVANYGYTGREPDQTGLIYYRARYYDPAIQRFTQRDPIGVAGGVNAYAYVGNSPVMLTDPSGNVPEGGSNTSGTSYPVENNTPKTAPTCGAVADGGVFPQLFPAGVADAPALRDRYYFMFAMASAGGVRSDAGVEGSGDAGEREDGIDFERMAQAMCSAQNPTGAQTTTLNSGSQNLSAALGGTRGATVNTSPMSSFGAASGANARGCFFFCLTTVEGVRSGSTLDEAVMAGAPFRELTGPTLNATYAAALTASPAIAMFGAAQMYMMPATSLGAGQLLRGMATSGGFSGLFYIAAANENATPAGLTTSVVGGMIAGGVVKQGLNYTAGLANTAFPLT